MIELKTLAEFKTSVELIAIGCGLTGHGRHCGILFKDYNDQKIKLLHYQRHLILGIDNDQSLHKIMKTFGWVNFAAVDPGGFRKDALLARIKTVNDKLSTSIPYGLQYQHSYIDIEGRLNLDEHSIGLTCATFVLSICKGFGFELINVDEWPSRADDHKWHNEVIEFMKKYHENGYNITLDHIKNVEDEKISARFRPEEITVSSSYSNLPAPFFYCETEGERLLSLLSTADFSI